MSVNPTAQSQRSILVIAPDATDQETWISALRAHGHVRTARTAEEALTLLRSERFTLVISRPRELFPLARAEARQRGELILDKIGQGVCIVNRAGELVWANPKLNSYPPAAIDAIRTHCAEVCAQLAAQRDTSEPVPSRRRTVRVAPDYVFDLTVSPLLAQSDNVEEVVGLVWDMSAAHKMQERLDTIDAAGRDMVRLDADALTQLDAIERLRILEEKIHRHAHDLLEFDHFVVRIMDKNTRRLDAVISSGLPDTAPDMQLYAAEEGNGITGYVAATGRSYICPDVSKDPRYLPGLERAGSSLTVPLLLNNEVVGIFNVESTELAAFDEDDRQFAEIFGRYVAVALHILKLLAVERSTTTGQITADVGTELAAPLNDILSEATGIIQDFIGQEDLRRRLHTIIDNVDRVKRSLRALTEVHGVRGLTPTTTDTDPLLDGKRVLIADDEDIIRETVADVLTKRGALAVSARDGQEAIAMVRTQHFDLVISDIKMPHHSGYEVFAATRGALPNCQVILITGFGYDPEHSIVRASKEGLAGVLFKPFKVDDLLSRVREALKPKAD